MDFSQSSHRVYKWTRHAGGTIKKLVVVVPYHRFRSWYHTTGIPQKFCGLWYHEKNTTKFFVVVVPYHRFLWCGMWYHGHMWYHKPNTKFSKKNFFSRYFLISNDFSLWYHKISWYHTIFFMWCGMVPRIFVVPQAKIVRNWKITRKKIFFWKFFIWFVVPHMVVVPHTIPRKLVVWYHDHRNFCGTFFSGTTTTKISVVFFLVVPRPRKFCGMVVVWYHTHVCCNLN